MSIPDDLVDRIIYFFFRLCCHLYVNYESTATPSILFLQTAWVTHLEPIQEVWIHGQGVDPISLWSRRVWQRVDEAEATANVYCEEMWKRLKNIARMPARTIKGVEAMVKAFRRFGVLFTDTRDIGSQDADEWAAATLLADIKALAAQVQL